MECPYCKSKSIIWDYSKGEIVCTSCGAVLDKIYSYDLPFEKSHSLTSKADYSKLYEKIERVRKWEERIMEKRVTNYNGALVKRESLSVAKIIESNEKYLIIYDVMSNIPQFRTKDMRYKMAVGLYLVDRDEFNKLKLTLGISEKYMHKILIKLNRGEKEKITNLLKKRLAEYTTENLALQSGEDKT